jgi:glycosyltransferase involved in cell wall biosynthesis
VICYSYFLPAYKAGGPIQSIANLIRNLYTDFDIYVLTSNTEFGGQQLEIEPNQWVDFEQNRAKVMYLSPENQSFFYIKKILQHLQPDKLFVNGIYSLPFTWIPALLYPAKTIVHVRGMLHAGALNQKSFKKKVFLTGIKSTGIQTKVTFCVSDEKEAHYTKAVFGEKVKVQIAQNFPASFEALPALYKETGEIKMLSIALISPMKNHALVLEALQQLKSRVVWDIYGPIKDQKYWEQCKQRIRNLPSNCEVNYKGELNPTQVYSTLKNYHVFILPSESENFGHALYEAMIAGKPIITSFNTPWNTLNENQAGWNVSLDPDEICEVIENTAALDNENYATKVEKVREYAFQAINREQIVRENINLFNSKHTIENQPSILSK